jgi:hypothetical protein
MDRTEETAMSISEQLELDLNVEAFDLDAFART